MRLTYQNNWENDSYFVDKNPISDLKRIRIGDTDYNVTARNVGVTVHDMGHEYRAYSTHYFIKVRLFGKPFEFDLRDLFEKKIRISALKYTLERKE